MELDALGFVIGQYAITGSGPLAVRNLREASDLDIIVLPEVWSQYSKTYPVKNEHFETIQIGNISLLGEGSYFSNPDIYPVDKQIEEADIIDNHAYVNLPTIRLFKEKLGREKDLKDIELIRSFLSK